LDTLWRYAGPMWLAALVLALGDWLAVGYRHRRLEYLLKPATLVAILAGAGLLLRGPHDPWQATFFLAGLACSLAGDVFLMLPGERFFRPGLGAFLLAHLCYVAGLNRTPPLWPTWAMLGAPAVLGIVLYRRIAAGLRRQGKGALLVPVAVYSLVLSLMLFSAWSTLLRPEWSALRKGLVVAGGSLFYASDAMLAWDRFVSPIPGGRVPIMVTYHLAQAALAASIALTG